MPQPLDLLPETSSQTAGPFVHIGLAPGAAGFRIYERELGHDIVGPDAPGERIRIVGRVIDGSGAPVKDVLIEAWQADANGIYASSSDPRHAEVSPGFRGWGRVIPNFETGTWTLMTIKPGRVPMPSGVPQAPHVSLWLVARGINVGLQTRLYFEDETRANAEDLVLNLIEQVHRRRTLIARKGEDGTYSFDVVLKGENETVFLDV